MCKCVFKTQCFSIFSALSLTAEKNFKEIPSVMAGVSGHVAWS